MATNKGKSTGSRGGSVSLAEEDRRYLTETMGEGGDIDSSNVMEALETFGLSSERVQRLRTAIADIDVKESVDKASEYLAQQIAGAKDYAKENPKKVGGVAAGVLVGASLLAIALRRAAGEDKKKSSSSKKPSPAPAPAPSKTSSKKSSGGSKTTVTVTTTPTKKSSGGGSKGSKKRRR